MSNQTSVAPAKTGLIKDKNIHILIALVIGLTLVFGLQPTNGLTEQGVRALAIIVACLYLMITVNTHWVCLLLSSLMIITRVLPANAVWANSIGHFSVTMMLVFTLVCQNLATHGVIDKVAIWFITRPFVKGRPYAFMTMFFFANMFIGLFMENLALTILFLNLAVVVCEKIGVKRGHSLYFCLMMGVMWGAGVLSIASPIAKLLPNVMIGLLHTNLGITVSYAQWLAIGVPYTLVMVALTMLVARFIIRPDVTPLKNLNVDEFATPPLSKAGRISMGAMIVLVAVVLLPDIFVTLGIFTAVSQFFIGMTANVHAIIVIIFLSTVRAEGKPIMDFAEATKKVPIPVLLFMGAIMLIGVPISAAENGIIDWLSHIFTPIVAGLSPLGILIGLVIGVLIVTQFMSNIVTFTLFFNVGIAMLVGTAFNFGALGVLLTFASAMAFVFPSASLVMPLYYGPEHITVGKALIPNLIFIVGCLLVLLAFIPLVQVVIPI